MPRLGSSTTKTNTAGSVTNRNGQWKLHWSFNYEFDWPANASTAAQGVALRGRACHDDLTAVLDKALAYAG